MAKTEKTGEQLLAEDTEKFKALATVAGAVTTEQLEMNQWLGRIQATQAIGSMLEALSLSQLQKIKDNKLYEQLKGQEKEINGKTYHLGTWKGFCKAIGATDRSIDTKLKDLQILGEEALEKAQNLGMTTRELAKLRKLDPSDQAVVIGEIEINTGDKDAIVELIENMSAKHVKDKEALQKQLDDEKAKTANAKAEYEALDQVVGERVNEIVSLKKELSMRESESPHQRAVAPAIELDKLRGDMHKFFDKIEPLFDFVEKDKELAGLLRVSRGQFLLEIKGYVNRLVDKYELGDVSTDDDQFDWVAEMEKDKANGEAPTYATAGVE